MGVIDFILNLAGLLVWLSWRSARFDILVRTPALTLIGTLKKAEPGRSRHWKYLAGLIGLLIARAMLYRMIGAAAEWVPSVNCVAITLPFRSDYAGHMFLYSLLSFLRILLVFHFWLLLLSALHHRSTEPDPILKLVRLHLAWLERLPAVIKWLMPLVITAALWLLFHPLLVYLAIIPRSQSVWHTIQQSLVIGLGSFTAWKWLITGLLFLYLINCYVYLGAHPFWNFLTVTASRLLAPFRLVPLRAGKMDFAPVVGIALVFLLARWIEGNLAFSPTLAIKGLPDLYQSLPL